MTQTSPGTALVFGATGGTGQAIVRAAAQQGWHTRAFVRDSAAAARLFNDLPVQPQLLVGDARNAADIADAISADITVVFDALGVYQPAAGGTDQADMNALIVAAMRAAGVRRYVCVSSLGVGTSRGQGNWLARLIQATRLKHTLADKELQEQSIRASGLDWTLLRPSRLMNGTAPDAYATWEEQPPNGGTGLVWQINRSTVAEFALACATDAASIGKAYAITSRK